VLTAAFIHLSESEAAKPLIS